MYAYAANNPVRYIDPDGRVTFPGFWLGIGQSGFRKVAPQQLAGYGDWMDAKASLLGFDIDGTAFRTENFTLRLWKGDYGGARQYLNGTRFEGIENFIGGAGGEIGFYNNDDRGLGADSGSSMSAVDLSNKIGLVSTSIEINSKSESRMIANRKEKSPSFWTTAFSWFSSNKKEDLYTKNTFTFKSEEQANNFYEILKKAESGAKSYEYNRNQTFDIRTIGKTVTVTWGE